MKIKNYTSSVPAESSIMLIEKLLVQAGATNISKFYQNQEPDGIMFSIMMGGHSVVFKLPAKQDQIFQKFKNDKKGSRSHSVLTTLKAQAKRTAWKILYDWVQIQCTMIMLEQVEVMEVFLPYAYDVATGQTLFEKVKENEYKLLSN